MPQIQQIKSTDSDDAKRSKQNAAIDRVNELDNTAADISAFSASANAAARRASEARDEARDLAEGVDVATTDLFEAADTAVAARVAAEEARNSADASATSAASSLTGADAAKDAAIAAASASSASAGLSDDARVAAEAAAVSAGDSAIAAAGSASAAAGDAVTATDKAAEAAATAASIAALEAAITANTAKETNADHTGDVTGDGELTIGDGKVTTPKIANKAATNAKLADMETATIKGRVAAGSGAPTDLTATQVAGILGLGSASLADAEDFATSEQGDKADNALPAANKASTLEIGEGLDDTKFITPLGLISAAGVFATAGGNMSDLSTSFEDRLAVTFTAKTARVFAIASVGCNHVNTNPVDIIGELRLMDNVTGLPVATVSGGETATNQFGKACRFSIHFVTAGLVIGRSYTARLFMRKGGAIGPSYPKEMRIDGFSL